MTRSAFLKFTFLLPGHSANPVGGFRVVYEYSNRLAELGHDVVIVNTCTLDINKTDRNIKKIISYVLRFIGLRGGYRPNKWFSVNPKIKILWNYSLEARKIPDADVIVATAWQTAEWLKEYGNEKGKKYYLIHDYEHFMSANEALKKRIANTYHFGFCNIVTSPAGVELLKECSAPVGAKISNGVDFDIYKLYNKINYEHRNLIGFPARKERFKGTSDVIAALRKIKNIYGESYKIWAYGPYIVPGLPEWIEFYLNPDNETISKMMNKTAIFILPSYYEGWGLPGAEAMACGAALITTDSVGVRDYATDNENSIYAEVGCPESISDKITLLLSNKKLRSKIAINGYKTIKYFSWDRSTNEMLKLLKKTQNKLADV